MSNNIILSIHCTSLLNITKIISVISINDNYNDKLIYTQKGIQVIGIIVVLLHSTDTVKKRKAGLFFNIVRLFNIVITCFYNLKSI